MLGVENPIRGNEDEGLEQEEDQNGISQSRGEDLLLDVPPIVAVVAGRVLSHLHLIG